MVYREAPQESCAVCKAATDGACPRCGKPLCPAHCPPPRRRCDTCEAEFDALANLYDADAPPHSPLAPALPDPEQGSGLLGAVSALARGITLWRLRRRFLRERPADLKSGSE
jgi:hypothetical protein